MLVVLATLGVPRNTSTTIAEDAISESQVRKVVDDWESYAVSPNVDGTIALLDDDVEIELRVPDGNDYKIAKYSKEYYKHAIEKDAKENRFYSRDDQKIIVSPDKNEALVFATVTEGSVADGHESRITVAEEMTLKRIKGELKIVRLVGTVIQEPQ